MPSHDRIDSIMTLRPVTVAPDTDLYQAFATMRRCGFRHLPVINHGELVGILSDRDVWRGGKQKDGVLQVANVPVRDVMSNSVVTCTAAERIGDAADMMLHFKIDALPVVNSDGAVIGILTSSDLLVALRRFDGLTDVGAVLEGHIKATEG